MGKDPTQTTAYSTARVAKIYSPQYYVNDEVSPGGLAACPLLPYHSFYFFSPKPLYQNESLRRSQSQQSNDYAAVNGRNARDHHEGNVPHHHHDDDDDYEMVLTKRCAPRSSSPHRFQQQQQPQQHVHEYTPRNRMAAAVAAPRRPNSGGSGAVSGSGRASADDDDPLSQLDSLLEDLNATRDSLSTLTSDSNVATAPVDYRSLHRRSGELAAATAAARSFSPGVFVCLTLLLA